MIFKSIVFKVDTNVGAAKNVNVKKQRIQIKLKKKSLNIILPTMYI